VLRVERACAGSSRPITSFAVTVERQIHAAAADLVAPGCRIDQVHPFRISPCPFPAELLLTTAAGPMACVVKTAPAGASRLGIEAAALDAMSQTGLDAPRVLAGPQTVPTDSGPVEILVMTRLPGQPLPWIRVSDVAILDRTCRLLFEAIERLHSLTERVMGLSVAEKLAQRTLEQELADVMARDSPWVATQLFQEAVDVLQHHLSRHQLPPVFSNGDYNPLNVLADDAGLTGWVDFEHAGFEDPLIGFPKFLFWSDDSGWKLASQIGLVERYLYHHRVTPATFAVRVVLRGLTHLHDTTTTNPPTVLINTIQHAITTLHGARTSRS